MKENIFWDKKLSNEEIKQILKDVSHPRFIEIAAVLLSRTNNAQEVFVNYLDKVDFCKNWRKIKRTMRRNKWSDNRIIYWNEFYNIIVKELNIKVNKTREVYKNERVKGISEIIVKRRKSLMWTQGELAEKIGKSQQIISFIEKGNSNFSIDILIKILDVLGLEIIITPAGTGAMALTETTSGYNFDNKYYK